MTSKFKWLIPCALLICGTVLAISQTSFLDIKSRLISTDQLQPGQTFEAVYILGGGTASLLAKYETAARLYKQDLFSSVCILSRPGLTEYNSTLGRNLSNDEWSLLHLKRFGLPKEAVHPVSIEAGFFGTFSEARGVSRLAQTRNWSSLLLLTSPHHTRRVRESFAHFLDETEISVIASTPQAGLYELLLEYLKLTIYRLLLLD